MFFFFFFFFFFFEKSDGMAGVSALRSRGLHWVWLFFVCFFFVFFVFFCFFFCICKVEKTCGERFRIWCSLVLSFLLPNHKHIDFFDQLGFAQKNTDP